MAVWDLTAGLAAVTTMRTAAVARDLVDFTPEKMCVRVNTEFILFF